MTRILIADDHPVVRQGLRTILESQADFSVVAEAADGISAVQLAKQHHPDLMLVDMVLPGMNGEEVARQITEQLPQTRVLILSMHFEESYVLQALRSGAYGYVLKEADPSELIHAIRQVSRGELFLSASLSEDRIKWFLEKAKEQAFDIYETLTDREREILHLAAQGMISAEIAETLRISPRTVETHRNNLMRKLGLHSQTELVKYAIKRKIVRP